MLGRRTLSLANLLIALSLAAPVAHAGGAGVGKATARPAGRADGAVPAARPPTRAGSGAAPALARRPTFRRGSLVRMKQLVKEAVRLDGPFTPITDQDGYGRGEGGITVFRTGPAEAHRVGPRSSKRPLRYFWFHGAGQSTRNEMITRLANAFHEAGVALEIYSMPYMGRDFDASLRLITSSPGKVLAGSHSAGGSALMEVIRRFPDKVLGAVAVNSFVHPVPGVPMLHFQGENDGGSRLLRGLLPVKEEPIEGKDGEATRPRFGEYEWGDRQVVVRRHADGSRDAVLRLGDHSARARATDDRDKAAASTSETTRAMNRALAETVRDFLGEIAPR